ncbi:unnamed protein product [Symbiodinium sp. CCMP2592]|nr:unnamed protein product [Symbiodinium sp. CCMP2592]
MAGGGARAWQQKKRDGAGQPTNAQDVSAGPSGTADVNEPNDDGGQEGTVAPEQRPPGPTAAEVSDPWQQAIDDGWGAPWQEHPWNDDGGGGWRDYHSHGSWKPAGRDWHSGSWSQGSWDSRTSWPADGILNRKQLRDFHTADVPRMGSFGDHGSGAAGDFGSRRVSAAFPTVWEQDGDDGWGGYGWSKDRTTEKLPVPDFEGAGTDEAEVGKGARSYIRKVQVWLRCTRLPAEQRALALYNALSGRAWVYAEELDLDVLASAAGVSYYLEWIQTRFAEVELNKISQVMGDLFKRFRRKSDQTIRDYTVEFERLLLRLQEVQCELPGTVKAWLFIDKLRLNESEELALLASVGNQWNLRLLQQAALMQERTLRKSSSDTKGGWRSGNGGPGRWPKNTVHMTAATGEESESEHEEQPEPHESDAELVPEELAVEHHTAYVAYQTAKDKYKAATQGRGTDPAEVRRRAEERLRQAKSRSFCAVCKRKGHWHKDEECPMKGKRPEATAEHKKSANECHTVHMVYMAGPVCEDHSGDLDSETALGTIDRTIQDMPVEPGHDKSRIWTGSTTRAVATTAPRRPRRGPHDTACTKTVAGHSWYESYCELAEKVGFTPEVLEITDNFKFGASRTHRSHFAVRAWFALGGRLFQTEVAVVPCEVPLLLSRPALSSLGLIYDVGGQKISFTKLSLEDLPLEYSSSGHPAVSVDQFLGKVPPADKGRGDLLVWVPPAEAHMTQGSVAEGTHAQGAEVGRTTVFFPKKVAPEVHNMLAEPWGLGGQSFLVWWSRDFWLETPSEMIRVHVTPRKHLFVPSNWKTQHGELKRALLKVLGPTRTTEYIPCLNEGAVLLSQCDQWQEACPETTCGLWVDRSRFSKAAAHAPSLDLAAATHGLRAPVGMENEEGADPGRAPGIRRGLPRALDTTGKPRMKGISKLTLGELLQKCQECQVTLPPKPTRGALISLLRTANQTPGEQVLAFGKFRGWMFKETPPGYRQWAQAEVAANANHSPELAMYASWAEAEDKRVIENLADDPEANPKVPVPTAKALGFGGASSSDGSTRSWLKVRRATPKTVTRRRKSGEDSSDELEAEIPEAAKEEIAALEAKLAAMKQKHRQPPGPAKK